LLNRSRLVKDTPGYIEDAIGTLRKKAFPIARQVANMKYAAKLEATMDEYRPSDTHPSKPSPKAMCQWKRTTGIFWISTSSLPSTPTQAEQHSFFPRLALT